jgi:hypothetical protein
VPTIVTLAFVSAPTPVLPRAPASTAGA